MAIQDLHTVDFCPHFVHFVPISITMITTKGSRCIVIMTTWCAGFRNLEQRAKSCVFAGFQLDWKTVSEYETVMSDFSSHLDVSDVKEATKVLAYSQEKNLLTVEAVELSIKSHSGQISLRKFRKTKVFIGSSDGCDLVISDDEYVSRKHCKLETIDDLLILTDLGSTNGTFYKGEKIDKACLQDGGAFTIGRTSISVKRSFAEEKIVPDKTRQIGDMLGASRSMREIFGLIKRIAKSDATVCITGESGTGKELVAREIHMGSARASRPFVAINCGAIPPNIIESELFGHEKGAFTGAAATHRGVFEQADGGTLFLDEIGEMPYELQTRLLRALETGSVRRIGGHRDIPVDVRIITATNQDLKKNVSNGRFREDLFFRLYILPIHIPPLRERKEDIPILARHFAKMFGFKGDGDPISEKAMQKLLSHTWPGNVRELKNTIQRAVVLNPSSVVRASDVNLADLTPRLTSGAIPLAAQEKEAIIEALKRSRGNQSKAAGLLKVARTTLSNKIRRYGIDVSVIKEE